MKVYLVNLQFSFNKVYEFDKELMDEDTDFSVEFQSEYIVKGHLPKAGRSSWESIKENWLE